MDAQQGIAIRINQSNREQPYNKTDSSFLNNEAISPESYYSVRDRLLDSVLNDRLKNCIDQMYRSGRTIGDGGLADAVRHEIKTGELVGGKSHITKATERVKNLENIISKQDLNPLDKMTAELLLSDLKNALEVKFHDK